MPKVLTWDGRRVPAELRKMPPGRYVFAPADEKRNEAGARPSRLSAEEQEGLRRALRSFEEGRTSSGPQVHARLERLVRRHERKSRSR